MGTASPPAVTAPALDSDTLGLTTLTAMAPVSWGTTYLVTTEFLPPGYS